MLALVALEYGTTPSSEPSIIPATDGQGNQSTSTAPSVTEIQALALAAANRQNQTEPTSPQQQAKARLASTGLGATGGIVETRPQGPLLMVFNQIRTQWQPSLFRMSGDNNRITLVLQTDNMFTPELALRDNYRNMLASLPPVLQSAGCRQCRVQIEAHTDNRLDSSASLLRSQKMAAAVLEVLSDNGWQQDLMSAQGLGDTQPQSPNNHLLTRTVNRRITLRITAPEPA